MLKSRIPLLAQKDADNVRPDTASLVPGRGDSAAVLVALHNSKNILGVYELKCVYQS